MKREGVLISGVNIQWPWSQLIASGEKVVETRSYPLPLKFLGQPLAIIETAGPRGKQNGILKAQIIGIVTFSKSFRYETEAQWKRDRKRHMVPLNDKQFRFNHEEAKFGWVISEVVKLPSPLNPPKTRGIVFASNCVVQLPL